MVAFKKITVAFTDGYCNAACLHTKLNLARDRMLTVVFLDYSSVRHYNEPSVNFVKCRIL